jgi:hypothetical protein
MTGCLAELSQVCEMLDSRYDDIKSGRVQSIDGEEVFRRLRQKAENRRDSQRSPVSHPTRQIRSFLRPIVDCGTVNSWSSSSFLYLES